jgi:hypothetical protein
MKLLIKKSLIGILENKMKVIIAGGRDYKPCTDKVLELVDCLKKFTVIAQKRNLNRLLKG